jgi:hypothetical protein
VLKLSELKVDYILPGHITFDEEKIYIGEHERHHGDV